MPPRNPDAKRAAPVQPEDLEIARLARRPPGIAESDGKANDAPASRVIVGLQRRALDVNDDAMYFRLKMALVRGLRRPFRRALIEVDGLDGPARTEASFIVVVEPDDPAMQARAEAVVARVIRWRRWRPSVADPYMAAAQKM